jgi:hypothetical protein
MDEWRYPACDNLEAQGHDPGCWWAEKEREVDDKSEVGHRVAEAWEAEAKRLRELLGRLEWAGKGPMEMCPACWQPRTAGHVPGCWLAKELDR